MLIMSTEVVKQKMELHDYCNKTTYKKVNFLGKGTFSEYYTITNKTTNLSYACKIIPKKSMPNDSIHSIGLRIHASLSHINVLEYLTFFSDTTNIYVVLELCRNRSMRELIIRRKTLTEPETRFYMKQILEGVSYLHEKRIIHRHLQLDTLFLNDELHVKIGGFSEAIDCDSEIKNTSFTGNPGYMAPEGLISECNSFGTDIWAFGCIMHGLLRGRLPFIGGGGPDVMREILTFEHKKITDISDDAKRMITGMLEFNADSRGTIKQLIQHDFIQNGLCPSSLPQSCLIITPIFENSDNFHNRKPLGDLNRDPSKIIATPNLEKAPIVKKQVFDGTASLSQLKTLLAKVLKIKPSQKHVFKEEMTDPAAQPIIWVSKWVDYSEKHGFGYQLSNDSVGVKFKDSTHLILLENGINLHYVDQTGAESYMTIDCHPEELKRKVTVLSYFRRYMNANLINIATPENLKKNVVPKVDSMFPMPYLHQWRRSENYVFMQLTNSTVQINFKDHTKIVMCPLMKAITYIDHTRKIKTFKFSSLEKVGYSVDFFKKMKCVHDVLTFRAY